MSVKCIDIKMFWVFLFALFVLIVLFPELVWAGTGDRIGSQALGYVDSITKFLRIVQGPWAYGAVFVAMVMAGAGLVMGSRWEEVGKTIFQIVIMGGFVFFAASLITYFWGVSSAEVLFYDCLYVSDVRVKECL